MKFDIVRAWKDENYRQSLSEEQRCSLPSNPAGELELSDLDLGAVAGGDGLVVVALLNDLTSFNILSPAVLSSCTHTRVTTN